MSADALISRLAGVRAVGPRRWIARCPAHEDRHPSLAVRELEDGRVLIHDFGGCGVTDVLSAIGLGLSDLYPDRALGDHLPRERRPFDAAAVLSCVGFEVEIASVAADNLANGITLSDIDRDRLRVAAVRLRNAEELAHGLLR
jgi:hypothetical protein